MERVKEVVNFEGGKVVIAFSKNQTQEAYPKAKRIERKVERHLLRNYNVPRNLNLYFVTF